MSLDWNVEKVDDYEEILEDGEWPVTEALIWYTMAIGMSSITEDNVTEFATRVHMWEKARGTTVIKVNETTDSLYSHHITEADVRRRIGLYTNVNRMMKLQFEKKLGAVLHDEAEIVVRNQQREREEAA